MDKEIKNIILSQLPSNMEVNDELIESIYNEMNEDLLETISKLLDIEQTSVEVKEDQKKWNKFREICDSYDAEMEKHIKKIQEQK